MLPKPSGLRIAAAIRVIALAILLSCFSLTIHTPTIHLARADNHIIYVDHDATGSNDGTSWNNAFTSLDAALTASTAGKEIWVAAGIYRPSDNLGFRLKADVAVYGGFAGTETELSERDFATNLTILSGDKGGDDSTDANGIITDTVNISGTNALHVARAFGPNIKASARLDGFVLTGGDATTHDTQCSMGACGGGFFAEFSGPTLANLTVIGNRATFGGGLYFALDSKPIVSNVKLINNKANQDGGGMLAQQGAATTLTNVEFTGNMAVRFGGGIYFNATSATLSTVQFTGNKSLGKDDPYGGGGMYNYNSSPTLTNVSFSGNEAQYGGGMHNNTDSSPTLNNVSFTGNHAVSVGGGMYNESNSNPTLSDVSFTSNSTDFGGGGMSSYDSSPILNNVSLTGNYAYTLGGGMFNQGGSPVLTNVTFNGNRGGHGGAVVNFSSDAIFTNVTFSGNRASSSGGAVENFGSAAIFTNVAFSGNRASEGGGIFNGDISKPLLQNTIVWGNTPDSIVSDPTDLEPSVPTYHHSLIQGLDPAGTGNLDGANPANMPNFVRPVNCGEDGCTDDPATPADESANDDYGDLRLQPGSPAIDAGDRHVEQLNGITTDLAGQPRIVAAKTLPAKVDLGAYEAQPAAHAGGPYSGNEGSAIALDGSTSPNNAAITTYAWDCTDDGTVDVSAATPTGSFCTYPQNGAYILRLTATFLGDKTDTTTTTVSVANVAPAYTAAPDQSSFAGNARLFMLGSFGDPGLEKSWNATIDWGDDTPPTQVMVNAPGTLPNSGYTYAVPGTFNVTVAVSDGESSHSGGFQVVVNPAPAGAPAVTAAENQTAFAGTEESFSLGSFSDPSSSGPWQVSVNWGDGSPLTQFSAAAPGALAARSHTYAATATYDVLVSVNDGALTGSDSFQIAVSSDPNNGSVTGVIFDDGNANGTQDEGEAGIPDVIVTLETVVGANAASFSLTRTTITNGDGRYRFDNLPPATYGLTFTPPAGYQVDGLDEVVVMVESGEVTAAPTIILQPDGFKIYLPAARHP
jgi:hypothetical protein